jgi:flagellar biosynthesis protein FliR
VDVINQFTTSGAAVLMLTMARVAGLFMVAPVFSSRLIPSRAKVLIALAIALGVAPSAGRAVAAPSSIAELAVLAVKEVLVGAAIAFSVALVFAAVAFAGSLIDLTVGFAFANVVDPLQGTQISVMGQLYSLLASVVFVAIGGPELIIAGLVRSFEVVPVTEMPAWQHLTAEIIRSMGGLFAVGLEVAAPVLVTLLVTDAAVGFLARVAPQMNIFGIELPGKIMAMFALLAVTAPFLVSSIAGQLSNGLDRMFTALLGAGA